MPNELDIDSTEFDKVPVPSVWQHTGYEKPYYVNSRYPFKPTPPEIPRIVRLVFITAHLKLMI